LQCEDLLFIGTLHAMQRGIVSVRASPFKSPDILEDEV